MVNQSLDNLEALMNASTITFLADNCFNPIFFALETELLGRLVDGGKNVKTIDCDGVLPWCFSNPLHLGRICLACKSIRKQGHKIADNGSHERMVLGIEPDIARVLESIVDNWCLEFGRAKELLTLTHGGVLIGPGIVSTLSFMTKEPNPDLNENKNVVRRLLLSSLIMADSLDKLFTSSDIGTLVVGNGRLATSWIASRMAEKYGNEIFSYEILPMTKSLKLVRGSPVHDIRVLKRQMVEITNALEVDESLRFEAIDFFEKNRFPENSQNTEVPQVRQNSSASGKN